MPQDFFSLFVTELQLTDNLFSPPGREGKGECVIKVLYISCRLLLKLWSSELRRI